MDYQFDLTWSQARTLAKAGAWVRRWNWTDRWIFRTAFLYWLAPDGDDPRVIRSTDFTRSDRLAGDWTTIWPDQKACLVPGPDDPDPPPEPDPQPEPAGPVLKQVEWTGPHNQRFAQKNGAIPNPIAGPARVVISGTVDDHLYVNGVLVGTQSGNLTTIADVTIFLGSGASLIWRGTNPTGGFFGGNITFAFYAQ